MTDPLSRWHAYVPDHQEYANPTTLHGYGWGVDYISSTFLNGWINYVDVVRAYAICRYSNEVVGDLVDGADVPIPPSKPPLIERVAAFNRCDHGHTDLYRLIGDDVLILAKEEYDPEPIGEGHGWWYFWFDCDVSDCCIGRFRTSDPDNVVHAAFDAWVRDRAGHRAAGKSYALDPKAFKGWVTW